MRIEKVFIQNINSLQGRFEIDFTGSGYSEGLFAITGPSGAGKTTVLDAVCLALYGKTPRIDTISETQDEIMSKGEEECSSEVVFISRGKRYKSSFSHRRAGGEKPFRPVKREIAEYLPDGTVKIIASLIKEASETIVNLTGLTYSQFTRSIMLAQFEFAEFLKADSNDRASILEQVSDMGIYRDISAAVYERAKKEKTDLEALRLKIQALPVMNAESIKALKSEKESLNASVYYQNSLRVGFYACRDGALKVQKLRIELEDYKKNSETLKLKLSEHTNMLREAEKHERESADALSALTETLKTVREQDGNIAVQSVTVRKLENDITEIEEKISFYKREILKVFTKYRPGATAAEHKTLYESEELGEALRSGLKSKLDSALAEENKIRESAISILQGRVPDYWQKRLDTLKAILPIAKAQAEVDCASVNLEIKNEELKKLLESQSEINGKLKDAEEKLVYARLNEKFSQERESLEDGTPCPLCGALNHPYEGRPRGLSFLTEAVRAKEELQKKDADIITGLADLKKAISDLKCTITEETEFVKQKSEEAGKSGMEVKEAQKEYENAEKMLISLTDAERVLREYYALVSKLNTLAKEEVSLREQLSDTDRDVSEILSNKRHIKTLDGEAEAKRKLRDGEARILEQLIARRKAVFGDKNADEEERKATESREGARLVKEQRKEYKEKAERDFAQNKNDISRTVGMIDNEAKVLKEAYANNRKDAFNMPVPSAGNEETAALFEDLNICISQLGEDAVDSAQNLSRVIGLLESLSAAQTRQQGAIDEKLKINTINEAMLKELKSGEARQISVCERWDRLNVLIGSAEGDKFSRMAQGYTFEALLRYANACLKRMTDRYVLVRDTGGGKPLELCVADIDQAGDTRPVINLSGGESFIVSLALALGLSEMSSSRTSIDSLFIDEGFASLDEDYLEAALQTLSSLGNREGKLVGVISHIGALKDRISAQIEVKKLSGGRSTLSGPGVSKL